MYIGYIVNISTTPQTVDGETTSTTDTDTTHMTRGAGTMLTDAMTYTMKGLYTLSVHDF